MLIRIRPRIWWRFKKGVLRCKIYIRSGMFSFGLANFLSLSDGMSDMLKKFSTSLGMHDPCDNPFLLIHVPCSDLDLDLWPTSRSNLLPGGGPQFFEFACLSFVPFWCLVFDMFWCCTVLDLVISTYFNHVNGAKCLIHINLCTESDLFPFLFSCIFKKEKQYKIAMILLCPVQGPWASSSCDKLTSLVHTVD